jgi:hypothetical protein
LPKFLGSNNRFSFNSLRMTSKTDYINSLTAITYFLSILCQWRHISIPWQQQQTLQFIDGTTKDFPSIPRQ